MTEGKSDFSIRSVVATGFNNLLRRRGQIPGQAEQEVHPEGIKRDKKEVVSRQENLGRQFQTRIAALEPENLPPVFEESMGVSGLLTTNEDLRDELIQQVAQSENSPNGYVFGAGLGNILSMVLLYPEDQIPQAILSIDVSPEVVLAGRIFTNILAGSKDFTSLYSALKDESRLREAYEKVLGKEQSEVVKKRLQKTTFDQIRDDIGAVLDREHLYLPKDGIKQSAFRGERVSVLAVVRDNFEVLQQLAQEGNIGVAYADITNQRVLEIVTRMPDFDNLRNIIYMSNVIDHLTQRGTDLTHISDIDALKDLGENDRNWFVDTTQKSQSYVLRASHKVPSYTRSDLI